MQTVLKSKVHFANKVLYSKDYSLSFFFHIDTHLKSGKDLIPKVPDARKD